jgi:hypothetical protein
MDFRIIGSVSLVVENVVVVVVMTGDSRPSVASMSSESRSPLNSDADEFGEDEYTHEGPKINERTNRIKNLLDVMQKWFILGDNITD